jgi:hypothetical protein
MTSYRKPEGVQLYGTRQYWNGNGEVTAEMSLDEWISLSANKDSIAGALTSPQELDQLPSATARHE